MERPLYYLGNSRSPEQTADMVELEAEAVCIFCPPHIQKRKTVVYESDQWVVTTNDFPYRHGKDGPPASLHLLISPKQHVEDLLELPAGVQDSLWDVLLWIRASYKLTHYGLGSRNGDVRFTGATIRHVHLHVVVGDPEAAEPIRLKLTSKPKETPPS